MPKQVSTPKESSGGGFLFEDEVVAYVLSHLVSRSSPFDPPGGLVERVDAQRPSSQWHLDDLLVTARAQSRHRRMASERRLLAPSRLLDLRLGRARLSWFRGRGGGIVLTAALAARFSRFSGSALDDPELG